MKNCILIGQKKKNIIQIFTKLYKMIELGLFYYLVYQITITKSHYQENNKSIKLLTIIKFKNFVTNIIFQEQFETSRD